MRALGFWSAACPLRTSSRHCRSVRSPWRHSRNGTPGPTPTHAATAAALPGRSALRRRRPGRSAPPLARFTPAASRRAAVSAPSTRLPVLVQGSDAAHATKLLARSAGSPLRASALTTARPQVGGVNDRPRVATASERTRSSRPAIAPRPHRSSSGTPTTSTSDMRLTTCESVSPLGAHLLANGSGCVTTTRTVARTRMRRACRRRGEAVARWPRPGSMCCAAATARSTRAGRSISSAGLSATEPASRAAIRPAGCRSSSSLRCRWPTARLLAARRHASSACRGQPRSVGRYRLASRVSGEDPRSWRS